MCLDKLLAALRKVEPSLAFLAVAASAEVRADLVVAWAAAVDLVEAEDVVASAEDPAVADPVAVEAPEALAESLAIAPAPIREHRSAARCSTLCGTQSWMRRLFR